MHIRRTRRSIPSHDLQKAEQDIILITIAEAIDRLSDFGIADSGRLMLSYLTTRYGLDTGWDALPETAQTANAAIKRLRSVPSLIRQRQPRRRSNALSKRLDWLAEVMGLDAVERAGLDVIARVDSLQDWRLLLEMVGHNEVNVEVLAILSGHSTAAIDRRFHAGARLAISGLVQCDDDGEIRIGRVLRRIVHARVSRPADLRARMMPEAPPSRLAADDFGHLGESADLACRLVEQSARSGAGVSILLYGPPGGGKTEFALHLARQAGLRPVMAGADDLDGAGEPDRSERLGHLALLRQLMSGERGHAIIADEADDMLDYGRGSPNRERYSKAWLNAFVDMAGPPTIWIVNEVGALPDTVVRRMDLVVRFDLPSQAVRSRIVERHAVELGLSLEESEVASLSVLPASPAVLEAAVAGAARIGGGAGHARVIGAGFVEALTGKMPVSISLPAVYDPALARADCDLDELAGKLVAAPDKGWSLLLHGPSGTGKSAYARHLAERLGLDLIEERGSDLLDAYVGGTERLIASAFARAARQKAVLLIDEADDFLSDRRDATRSWERTMVNEMLRQMENLRMPFIATTNFAEKLDPATRRRFTLQAGFLPLDEKRARSLFVKWFGEEAPAGARLANLTPGDFALVARRAELLGEVKVCKVLKWLGEEGSQRLPLRQAIGFGVGMSTRGTA